ncbi:MAG: hypothetical protein AB1635_12785 [Acidobacteriota bacterium]
MQPLPASPDGVSAARLAADRFGYARVCLFLTVVACTVGLAGQAAVVTKATEGFAISLPTGWVETTEPGIAAAVAPKADPGVSVMVLVQTEPTDALVTDVLAKAAARLKGDGSRTVVSTAFDVVLDRPALIAVLEDATTRYKLTLLPREQGERSRIFYGIMAAAPRGRFAAVAPVLDKVAAGFRVLPGPVTPATAPVGSSTTAIDRAAVIDRILAPRPRP